MPAHNRPDYSDVTQNQKITWTSGDFNQIARQNWVMAEDLCKAVDPLPGQKVLDVACGSGTAALVAERRYCNVTGIDYVPELIKRAKWRAEANGQSVDFQVGDAQELPFEDDSFDVVLSIYGVQFAPDQKRAAREMTRVCKPGGIIGLASPIQSGWSGDFFSVHGRYMPPPPGLNSPLRWGTDEGVEELLGDFCKSIKHSTQKALQYYRSTDHAVEVFSRWFGPTIRACESLNQNQRDQLLADLKEVFERYNQVDNGTAVVENTYLMTIAVTS
jgi:ubiquinone/menaquinone biosynthesis C-methylase UbiE